MKRQWLGCGSHRVWEYKHCYNRSHHWATCKKEKRPLPQIWWRDEGKKARYASTVQARHWCTKKKYTLAHNPILQARALNFHTILNQSSCRRPAQSCIQTPLHPSGESPLHVFLQPRFHRDSGSIDYNYALLIVMFWQNRSKLAPYASVSALKCHVW